MKEDRFLQKRGDIYYFRVKIPADLRTAFQGRLELKRSLHTQTNKKAVPLARKWTQRADELFFQLRMGIMTKKQMDQLVADFAKSETAKAADAQSWGVGVPFYPEDLDRKIETLKECIHIRSQDLKNGDIERFEPEVDDILRRAGVSVDKTSSDYKKLCTLLFQKTIDLDKAELARRKQSYPEDLAALERRLCRHSPAEPELSQPENTLNLRNLNQSITETDSSMFLSEAIKKYIAHLKTTRHEEIVSIDEYNGILNLFQKIIGDQRVKNIDISFIDKYINAQKNLPSKHHILKIFRNRSIDEKIGMVMEAKKMAKQKNDKNLEIQTTSPTTIKKHLTLVKSFLNYLETYNFIEKHPARDYHYKSRKQNQDHEERDIFTHQELQKMIAALAEEKARGKFIKAPERFWITLIGPFSGMRLNEICQLHIEDIIQDDEIWCFDVNDDGTKRVKNHEKRKVPIHPILIELGFLDYFEKVKSQKKPRLWMNLPYREPKGYYKNYGRWFNGDKGIKPFKDKFIHSYGERTLDFHSFRHCLVTDLKHQLVDEILTQAIIGHKHGHIAYERYGKPFLTRVLFDALKKVTYGLDFSALMADT